MKTKLLVGLLLLGAAMFVAWPIIRSFSHHHDHSMVRTYNKSNAIAIAYLNWMSEYGERPSATDQPMVDILNQGGPKQIRFLDDRDVEDAWGTKFRVYIGNGEMIVWSAGRDRKFSEVPGEGDDLIFAQAIK
ncbi:MAG: hypothetical protein H7A51_13770 [Akkermansiaceae bacterium]|nr:hypothetical protein [Akkermansiaceae bacterium]